MSPGFFKRKAKAPSDTEFRGPLDLVPGDRVSYYQQEFTLAGVVFLVCGRERTCQYHFLDADQMHVVLVFEPGPEPQITLEHALAEENRPDTSVDHVEIDDAMFSLKTEFNATAFCIGGIPGEKGAAATCRIFEDSDEMETLVAEDWTGYVEVRRGEVVHENELVVKRQRDEDEWDIKPPPRIDLRSLNEARRSLQIEEQQAVEKKQVDELAGARQKLAAFSEEPDSFGDDDEDAVALSDIVDPHFRFPEEPPPEAALETELPSFAEAPAKGDPFSTVFGDEDLEDANDYTPDPYQEYMENERQEEFSDEDDGGNVPTDTEADESLPGQDLPSSYLTEDTTDEFLNAGIYDEDDDLI